MKLHVVLLSAAIFTFTSAATVQLPPDIVEDSGLRSETFKIDENGFNILDDIDLDALSDEELESLMEAEDELLSGYLDVYVGANKIQNQKHENGVRRKRWIPLAIGAGRLAFSAGRALFSRFASRGITRSAGKLTKHYSRPGNYFSGLREFKNLNPTNVKRIGGSKFNGWTGTSGPYRLTIRSGSRGTTGSNGAPTFSISSKGGKLIRKFRFE